MNIYHIIISIMYVVVGIGWFQFYRRKKDPFLFCIFAGVAWFLMIFFMVVFDFIDEILEQIDKWKK